jgi:hypothetical protein
VSDLGTDLMLLFHGFPAMALLTSSHFTPFLTITVLHRAVVLEQADELASVSPKRQF